MTNTELIAFERMPGRDPRTVLEHDLADALEAAEAELAALRETYQKDCWALVQESRKFAEALAAETARLDTLAEVDDLQWGRRMITGENTVSVHTLGGREHEPHDGTEAGKRVALRALLDRVNPGKDNT